MRLLLPAALAAIATTTAAAPVTTEKPSHPLKPAATDKCQRTTSHHAVLRPGPQKLTELPPAVAYMAVYRTVNGCEVPMTVVEYRTGRKP